MMSNDVLRVLEYFTLALNDELAAVCRDDRNEDKQHSPCVLVM
jgi:hypothetical protein